MFLIVALKATEGKLQCGGHGPLYEGLEHGGSEGVEQSARVHSGLRFGGDGVDGCHCW